MPQIGNGKLNTSRTTSQKSHKARTARSGNFTVKLMEVVKQVTRKDKVCKEKNRKEVTENGNWRNEKELMG